MKKLENQRSRIRKLVGSSVKFYALIIIHFSMMVAAIILQNTPYLSTIVFVFIFLCPSYYVWLIYSIADDVLGSENRAG